MPQKSNNPPAFPSNKEKVECSATALPDWHRLTLLHDGKEIMGCTITSKRPENHEQMTSLIRELLAMMEAPTGAASSDWFGINERKTNMKYWVDKFEICDRSPYNCIERVKTPLTKTLLLVGFVPWFLLWMNLRRQSQNTQRNGMKINWKTKMWRWLMLRHFRQCYREKNYSTFQAG